MKESYDISVLFKVFKRFKKSGPDFDLRRKMMVNEGNLAVPESPISIYYRLRKRSIVFRVQPKCRDTTVSDVPAFSI